MKTYTIVGGVNGVGKSSLTGVLKSRTTDLGVIVDLDKIRIVRVTGFVNAVPEFGDQPKVVNGASELLEKLYGANGKHARSAIGVGSLPTNASVEVEIIAEILE